ncbi:TonB-dependent outer membrane receptor [Nitritalea halalkaliphila LW7]|uniref:TonB-dependent outer membrane receptor n=1 Tax=Nitritalea halalkaliphila LW7 TaxID=1189621 RepID=I5BSG0_9BACT|nr:carboxypeptidase-like regulatory domain-containing protein [Nitritalea halalkaliphila]EIM72512.1 TonB-dependent outer membrane receptor [Nitritalea halalkaliphila LW7]
MKTWSKSFWGWLLGISFLMISHAEAQVVIQGTVTDEETGAPLRSVSVSVTNYTDEVILAFTNTNADGQFQLTVPEELEFFTLAFRKMGYQPLKRDLLLAEVERKELTLDFQLSPAALELEEVVVESRRPPIIVKSDTILFDIQHYERRDDQNLEDILKRIPGFKVQAGVSWSIMGA